MSEMSRLREVAEAATPGPWMVGETWWLEGVEHEVVLSPGDCEVAFTHPKDVDHIATFDPPTVLALLDRLEAAEAKVARVEALADECADSPCIHLNTMWGSLRAALSAPQTADAPEGHGDADEAGA